METPDRRSRFHCKISNSYRVNRCDHSLSGCATEYVPRPTPPEILYDEDGVVMAVLKEENVDSVKLAARIVLDVEDWRHEDLFVQIGDDESEVFRPRLSEYRAFLKEFRTGFFRPADPLTKEEIEGEFGVESWWPTKDYDPRGVAYWIAPN